MLEVMSPPAGAQAAGPTKRLVVFFTPNATNDATLFVPAQTGTNFVLPVETAPLESLRSKLLIVSNVNMESAKKQGAVGDLHSIGMSHMLTATPWGGPASGFEKPGGSPFEVGFAGGISIDQYIGKKVGTATKFPTLEFGAISISDYGVHPFSRMISAGLNMPIPAQDDPAAMFKRVFSDGAPTTMPGADVAVISAQRKSVLDYVGDDMTRLESRLGPTDRQKIDAHLTAIRNLETRLGKAPTTSCSATPIAPAVGDPLNKANYPAIAKAQMDLLALSLQCDVTRVASFQMSWARSMLSHPWAKVTDAHHTLSHGPASPTLSQINTWYASQVAYLGTALNSISDGNGKTLLDNTLLYWCGECARGYDHDFNNIRIFILGTGGGAIKTGQHIKMTGNAVPHNQLMVTLMNAMGIPDNQFGDPQWGTGPLPGVATA
jgi:hypothetical protein